MGDLSAHANAQGARREAGLSAASLATLVDLIGEGVISGKIAKDLLAMLLDADKGADPRALVEARGLRQVTDAGAIDAAVEAVVAANPDKAEQAKAKPGMLGWFVGQVMKATGGKANPQAVSDALKATARSQRGANCLCESLRFAFASLRSMRTHREPLVATKM